MFEAGRYLVRFVRCRTADDGPFTRRTHTSLLRGTAVTDAAVSVGMFALLYMVTVPLLAVAAIFGFAVRRVKQTGTLD